MSIEIVPSYKGSRERLLVAVQSDKWLPILQQPFDHREQDPRLEEALKTSRIILGRLAVTLHATYEESCGPGFPLLLSDKSKRKLQYAIEASKPGFYHLVLLQGKEEKKQRFCQMAKFALVPESSLERAKRNFLVHPEYTDEAYTYYYGGESGSWHPYHIPYLEYYDYYKKPIDGASHCIVFEFNREHRIRAVVANQSNGRFRSYYFLDRDDVSVEYGQASHANWFNGRATMKGVLNRDGVFRKENGEAVTVSLAEELLELSSKLPVEHHIRM